MPMPKTERNSDRNYKVEAEELADFMNHHGISVRELAEILGVSESAVKSWRCGFREMDLTKSRLIRLFDKRPELLREF